MNASTIFILSLCLGAAGIALWAGAFFWRFWRMQKVGARLEEIVRDYSSDLTTAADTKNADKTLDASFETDDVQLSGGLPSFLGSGASAWLQKGWARVLFPDEDRALFDQAGIGVLQSAAVYVASRVIFAALLPLLVLNLTGAQGFKALFAVFCGLGVGLMLPKWIVQSMASKRRKRVEEELPLFVDMLRLLQGVGLSVDQSLHILANEFGRILKVIAAELGVANRLYATGRSREQAFQRLMHLSGDDDMVAVVNLLVQVDKHGGAVQEPLAQFAQRLREKRQASFKEKIGTITVKMTGVMVLTLLPALIVITAGPGFMAVMRSLSSMK